MSKLGWVNFDSDELKRVQDLIQALSEPDTVDDLGLGAIRDTIADHLFPGVSTIQTRLRYFILVPRLIVGGAKERKPDPSEWMRRKELALIELLKKNKQEDAEPSSDWAGLFGSSSGQNLKRRPSAVYWNGLKEWGILEKPASVSEAISASAQAFGAVLEKDGGVPITDVWHPRLPHLHDSPLSQHETLTLSIQEADFLLEQLREHHRASLLTWLLTHSNRVAPYLDKTPWSILELEDVQLPEILKVDIRQAERFSTLMHGAQLLYNLLLSKHFEQEQNQEEYQKKLEAWREVVDNRPDLKNDSLLWPTPKNQRHRIRETAGKFVTNWRDVGLEDPFGDNARELVRARQAQVKPSNSKLQKPKTYEWGGNSGSTKLTFRWSNVVRFIKDINDAN